MKRYNSDWAKSKSRSMVRDLISRSLLPVSRPQDLRVLCFPGVDAAEIFEVYDKLEIPRENITGLEREKEIADILHDKQLGIEVVNDSLDQFVASHEEFCYDIISLDFIGPIGRELNSAWRLLRKNTGRDIVFHTANLVRRDHRSKGIYRYGHFMDKWTDNEYDNLEKALDSCFDRLYSYSNDKKSSSYMSMTASCLKGGVKKHYDRLFKFLCGRQYHQVIDIIEDTITQTTGRHLNIDRDHPHSSKPGRGIILANIATACRNIMSRKCSTYGITDEKIQAVMMSALYDTCRDGSKYSIREGVFYKYISESGAPMMGDAWFASRLEKQISDRIADLIGYPDQFKITDMDELNRYIILYGIEMLMYERKGTLKREFLGKSTKPLLTKKRAIAEFDNGTSLPEIKDKYRGWEKKPLAQWKAHHTMGRYTPELSKQDALDLIRSGIPLKEIHEAYPSYSEGTLRAYKAHIKMKHY